MRNVLLIVITLVISARGADAQSSAIAEQLFNEARDLGKAGKWAEACPKFEASFKQDPALGTRLNLANCYERINKLATAWGTYRDAAAFAQKAGDAKRADYANKQAQLLEPRLPKLTVTPPAAQPTGFAVTRDGNAVTPAEFGLALYVDPGEHEVAASAPGFLSISLKVTSVEGKAETVVIPDLAVDPDQAKPPPEEDKPIEPVVDDVPVSSTRKYVGLGVAGGGLVAVGVGLVFGMKAMTANDDAKKLCGEDLQCSAANLSKGQQLIDDGRTKGTISTVLVVAGGAALVAGAVLYFTAPRKAEARTARVVPTIDSSGAGIAFAGSF